MSHEQTRKERFTSYAAILRERFASGVLSELQSLPQWVVWRGELEGEKHKKVSYNPHYKNARASVKISKSWGTLEQSLIALETGNYSGIGFMLTPPLVLVDLDKSFDRVTRIITNPQAAEIVQALNSYTEVSPGKGLHILCYGRLAGRGIHTGIEICPVPGIIDIATRKGIGSNGQETEELYARVQTQSGAGKLAA